MGNFNNALCWEKEGVEAHGDTFEMLLWVFLHAMYATINRTHSPL